MLKKISLGLILGTLLILFSTPQQVVRADQLESRATIKLHPESPTKPVDPVDPNNPDQEYPGDKTDDGNQGTGTVASLSLDYVSNFHFQTETKQTNVTAPLTNQLAMVQVSDRRGTGAGWVLQLKPDALVGRATQAVLNHGELILGNLTLKAPSSNVSDRPQIITKKISLGAYNNVMRANNGQGLGTWVLGFPKNQQNPTKLILNNLNDAPADHYFGVLNWSLTDAPN